MERWKSLSVRVLKYCLLSAKFAQFLVTVKFVLPTSLFSWVCLERTLSERIKTLSQETRLKGRSWGVWGLPEVHVQSWFDNWNMGKLEAPGPAAHPPKMWSVCLIRNPCNPLQDQTPLSLHSPFFCTQSVFYQHNNMLLLNKFRKTVTREDHHRYSRHLKVKMWNLGVFPIVLFLQSLRNSWTKCFSLFFQEVFFWGEAPNLWHMEFPRLGVQSELQLPDCPTATATPDPSRVCDLQHSTRQHWILKPLTERGQGCNLSPHGY